MHDENIHDDIRFDRLVDGELSAGERRGLLESLDARPDGWRRCALAFLEAQSWGDDLAELVRRPADAKISAQPVVNNQRPARHGAAWLAVAAGLLVAVTLGVMRRNNGFDDGPPVAGEAKPNEPVAVVAPPSAPPPEQANADDALALWVRDDAGHPRLLRVPLVDAGTLDRQLGVTFQPGLPADVRNQLQDRGYDVQSKRRYAPLWFENGRPMIVPVEDTKIVPVSQKVW